MRDFGEVYTTSGREVVSNVRLCVALGRIDSLISITFNVFAFVDPRHVSYHGLELFAV